MSDVAAAAGNDHVVVLVVARVPLLGRFAAKNVRPMLDVHLDFIEQELDRRPWFAGAELTAADFMMSFPLESARACKLIGGRKATLSWIERIQAGPAYKQALKKGSDYLYA